MRITGGECRGRTITAPDGLEVRPTSSKIRQAFFNILGNSLDGARFVDMCAGTGLMGIEALSRGAASLIAIEDAKRIAQEIEANVKRLGFQACSEIICGDVKRVLPLLNPGEGDIMFADPPYRSQLAPKIMRLVEELGLLSENGVLAIESSNDTKLDEELGQLIQYDRRKYGQTAITFFRLK